MNLDIEGGESASQMKKGFIRLFILATLYRQPSHGYGIMKAITRKSHGFWSPKAGNIYPLIHTMAGEGLIKEVSPPSRRRVFEITDRGKMELLRLFSEAEEATTHLVQAMSDSKGEWIQAHIELLGSLDPDNRDKKIQSMIGTIDTIQGVFTGIRKRLEEASRNPKPSRRDNDNAGD